MRLDLDGTADDVVKVAVGNPTQAEAWLGVLRDAGINARVVGDHLAGGLGSALSGSVELWVRGADAQAAWTTLGCHNSG
jgi:Putative prokaryotic signal transducing protein